MSVIDLLKNKYPDHRVYKEPLDKCPLCKGSGEFLMWNVDTLCLCVALSEPDKSRRSQVYQLINAMILKNPGCLSRPGRVNPDNVSHRDGAAPDASV